MLFRHISEHIRTQNWFAVGLDLVIVVIGVFIAVQVDSWNEARKERAEEMQYLSRLHEDLSASIARTQANIEFMTAHADRAGVVMRSLEMCRIPPTERGAFANGLYQLGKLTPPQLGRATIDELRSTGKLRILRNVRLRSMINEMLAEYESQIGIFSQAEGRLHPHINYVDSVVVYKIEKPTAGSTELSFEDIDLAFDALCSDRRFFTAVAAARNYTYDVITWSSTAVARYEEVRAALAEELGR